MKNTFLGLILLFSIGTTIGQKRMLTDKDATKATVALYDFLNNLPKGQFLFGHQDDLAYGVKWKEEYKRSDVKDVVGTYPAMHGWELSKLGKSEINIDSVNFKYMKKLMKLAHKEGGINTISWHVDNFATGGNSWDNTPAVHTIIPGGEHHQWYKEKLDTFALFLKDVHTGHWFWKKPIPMIFRPFHEHTGSWFWWGKPNTTAEDYITLLRFTYNYLTKEKDVHNLIYAYSPDVFSSKEQYMEFYPGDEFVDILGFDDYHDVGAHGKKEEFVNRLTMLAEMAADKNKPFALSETGHEQLPRSDWFTGVLLEGILGNEKTKGLAYVMVWRNARTNHHYAPYLGHPSAADFKKFEELSNTLFSKDIKGKIK